MKTTATKGWGEASAGQYRKFARPQSFDRKYARTNEPNRFPGQRTPQPPITSRQEALTHLPPLRGSNSLSTCQMYYALISISRLRVYHSLIKWSPMELIVISCPIVFSETRCILIFMSHSQTLLGVTFSPALRFILSHTLSSALAARKPLIIWLYRGLYRGRNKRFSFCAISYWFSGFHSSLLA